MLTLLQADPTSMLEKAEESILNFKLIDTSKFALTLWDVVVIAIIILGATLLLQLIKKGIFSAKGIETGKKYSLYNLVKYIVVFITFMWALQSLGVNVSLLMGGSAALLVGIGLGLQNLFSDFVSGIILLADSSIRVGDVIEVDGLVCQVTKIKLRTTQVVTRDDKCILLPNTQLTKNRIINWSHNNEKSRFDDSVGVDYGSDPQQVIAILKQVAQENPEVETSPAPFVRFNKFADSSLEFTVYFWAKNMFRVENIKSSIREKIFEKFRANNITIPFPQRTLHYAPDTELGVSKNDNNNLN